MAPHVRLLLRHENWLPPTVGLLTDRPLTFASWDVRARGDRPVHVRRWASFAPDQCAQYQVTPLHTPNPVRVYYRARLRVPAYALGANQQDQEQEYLLP